MYLIGYLSTCDKTTYGKSKNGSKIYLVTSFTDKENKFLISYNSKLNGTIIIKFKISENKNNNFKNLLNGEIIDIIGKMNDDNLIITLQYIYNVYRKNIFKNICYNNNINRILIENEYIFSIDPSINCEDIDDALSFSENNENYIVKVYIAQPIYYLTEDLLMNITNFSTLYNDKFSKNNHLFGDKITNLSSLIINEKKPAYCIIFYINKKELDIIQIEDYPVFIINNLQTTYDLCKNYKPIKKLYDLTNKLSNNKVDLKLDITEHELISYWMIKTNNYIGNKYKYLNLPYRVMKNNIIDNIIIDDININIKNIFINRSLESAYYSTEEFYHYKLDIFNYIHFTSPIRRIIDTLIHWCITYNINFIDLLNKYNISIDHINKLSKNTKKYHKNIKLLKNIDNLIWDQNLKCNLNGYVYKISELKNRVNVYFEELGFMNVKIDNDLININKIIIGKKYNFIVYKKLGFLPFDKIFIKFNL
jgi:hypothetical protein